MTLNRAATQTEPPVSVVHCCEFPLTLDRRCYGINPVATTSYTFPKLLQKLVIYMLSTLTPKSLLSHEFVRGTRSSLQTGAVYSTSSYNT